MIPMIYIPIILAWLLLIFGFNLKDYQLLAFSSFFLMALGAYIIFYGLEDISNIATLAFAFVQIGVGAYVIMRGAYEIYKEGY